VGVSRSLCADRWTLQLYACHDVALSVEPSAAAQCCPTAQFEGKSEGEYDQLAGLANNVLGTPVGKVGGVVLL